MDLERKIYTDRELWIGTILGGPLVAGYFMAKNFQTFGSRRSAAYAWCFAIVIFLISLAVSFALSDNDKVPFYAIPIFYTLILSAVFRGVQGREVDKHLKAGGRIQSWWNVIAVSIAGLTIPLAVTFGIFFLSGGFSNPLILKSYGTLKHEITFDSNDFPETEVDRIADSLWKTRFFDNEKQKFVYLKKIGNNYEISISCNDSIKSDQEGVLWFIGMRKELQKSFPDKKIVVNLFIERLDNVAKRLE